MPAAGRAAAAALVAAWAAAAAVSAHDFSRSTSRLTVHGRSVRAAIAIGATDLHQGPPVDADGDGVASVEEVDAAIAAVFAALKQHYRVSADAGSPASVVLTRYGVGDDGTLRLDLDFTFAAPVRLLTLESTLPALTQPDHRHFVHATIGDVGREAVLDGASPRATFDGTTAPLATARRFAALGVGHIVTGYDHLAFLAVLLLAAVSVADVIKIVTAFTVAHSVTLGLTTMGLLTLPAVLVESLIALSIAWVAVENLLVERHERRWRITFLFGLVHGLGFAGVLRDLELAPGALALSLFSFNAGVEFGQLAFVALVLPLVWWTRQTRWHAPLALAGSSAVLSLGVFWFVQRLLLA